MDFNYLIPSTLEFRSGGATSTQVTVAIVDDDTVEMDEEFSVQISSINPRVTVQQGTADVTITDDDGNESFLESFYNSMMLFLSQLLNLALRMLVTLFLSWLEWLRWVWSSTVAPPSLSL